MKNKRTKRIGKFLCWVGLILGLLFGAFFYYTLNTDFLQRNIQKSVLKMDKEMQSLIEKGLNHDELEKTRTGLNVFMSDTLVFWNSNEVNPKLMKRIIF